MDIIRMGPALDAGTQASSYDTDLWNLRVGPFYEAAVVMGILGVTTDRLRELVTAGEVIELTADSGEAVYPTFQFDGLESTPVPRLAELLANLREWPNDPWLVASWLNRRLRMWNDRSIVDLLRTDWRDEVVLPTEELEGTDTGPPPSNAQYMMLARPVFNRFRELIDDLPVYIDPRTLFVSRGIQPVQATFLVTYPQKPGGFGIMHFPLNGGVDETAHALAQELRDSSW